MTSEEFAKIVSDWLATARDRRFNRPYTELVYQPMLELLAYLRANGFKTFIVSGRRHRIHAPVDRKDLWDSAPAGCWLLHQDTVRDARRPAN